MGSCTKIGEWVLVRSEWVGGEDGSVVGRSVGRDKPNSKSGRWVGGSGVGKGGGGEGGGGRREFGQGAKEDNHRPPPPGDEVPQPLVRELAGVAGRAGREQETSLRCEGTSATPRLRDWSREAR